MKNLITICARGGSKGIPGKNIKELNGIPLIEYTIRTAKNFIKKYKADIAISTDDLNILKICKQYGLSTKYLRPKYLATDKSGKIDVIRHLLYYTERIKNKKFDFIIDLDVSSPLRNVQDLSLAFEKLKKDDNALNIFSVSPAQKNPYFNMVEVNNTGYTNIVKDKGSIKSRQTAPKVFVLNASFYIYRREFFNLDYQQPIVKKSLIYIVPHICFDLDEMIDFYIMEFLIKKNLLDFKL